MGRIDWVGVILIPWYSVERLREERARALGPSGENLVTGRCIDGLIWCDLVMYVSYRLLWVLFGAERVGGEELP